MAYIDTTPRAGGGAGPNVPLDRPADSHPEIHQMLEARRAEETRIAQKVNAAHREAFHQKFPGQVEHCMRLIAERLQLGLRKDSEMQISDGSAKDLTLALWNLYRIRCDLDTPRE
jgi:hypothetical protein